MPERRAGCGVPANPPLRGTIARVTVPPDADIEDGERDQKDSTMLWIAAGSAPHAESPYASSWAGGE